MNELFFSIGLSCSLLAFLAFVLVETNCLLVCLKLTEKQGKSFMNRARHALDNVYTFYSTDSN